MQRKNCTSRPGCCVPLKCRRGLGAQLLSVPSKTGQKSNRSAFSRNLSDYVAKTSYTFEMLAAKLGGLVFVVPPRIEHSGIVLRLHRRQRIFVPCGDRMDRFVPFRHPIVPRTKHAVEGAASRPQFIAAFRG